jgi:hypothetical protein
VGVAGSAKGVFVKTYGWLHTLAVCLRSTPIEPSFSSVVFLLTAQVANLRAAIPHVTVQIENF